MRSLLKIVKVLFLTALILLIMAYVAIRFFLPEDKILDAISSEALKTLGVELTIGAVGITHRAFYARDIQAKKVFDNGHLVHMDISKAYLSFSWMSLIKFDPEFYSLSLREAKIVYKQPFLDNLSFSGDKIDFLLQKHIPQYSFNNFEAITKVIDEVFIGNFEVSCTDPLLCFSDISASLKIDSSGVQIHPFGFSYLEDMYSGTLQLQAEDNLLLSGNIASEISSLEGKVIFEQEKIVIPELSATLYGSSIASSGHITFVDPFQLALTLDGEINLREIYQYLTSKNIVKENILMPRGAMLCRAKIRADGRRKHPLSAEASLQSQSLEIHNTLLSNFDATLLYKNGLLESRSIKADLFDGFMQGYLTISALEAKAPYTFKGVFNNISLREILLAYTKEKDPFTGRLDVACDLQGTFADFSRSFSGLGSLRLTEGELWRLPIMRGILLNIPLPFIGKAAITDGNGSFLIKNRRVFSDDMRFKGGAARIAARGSVGFDKTLDLDVNIENLGASVEKIPMVGKLLGKVGDLLPGLSAVKITGTIEDPKYRPLSLSK